MLIVCRDRSATISVQKKEARVDHQIHLLSETVCMHPHTIGQHLVEHCTENLQYGKCELCQVETYSSEPSSQMSCEPCTSCSHQNGT